MKEIFFVLIISYLLGSTPTGFLIAKKIKGIDLREAGSGSTGATNVLRNVGKWSALFVFTVDVLKGFVAVKIAHTFINIDLVEILAGVFAISGHIWPIWLKGKGGKAVATGLGMFLALAWQVGLSALGIFLLVLSIYKIVSLASISGAISLPILMYAKTGTLDQPFTIISFIISILVIWKHRENIRRMIKGKEPRLKNKST